MKAKGSLHILISGDPSHQTTPDSGQRSVLVTCSLKIQHLGPNLVTRFPFLILAEMKAVYGLHPNEDRMRSSFGSCALLLPGTGES